jgi:UDPglucose 6-dehydrogenase
VTAFDPIAGPRAAALLPAGVEICATLEDALRDADAAVIVTEWPEFRAILEPAVRDTMRTALIVDGRNLLDPVDAAAAGFAYVPIGRSDRDPDREPLEA